MTTENALAVLESVLKAALEPIRAELAALREEIQHLTRSTLSPTDRRELRLVLPAAHALLGTALWNAAELAAAARDETAGEVAQVISDHASEDGGHRSLGRLLARCDGATSGGYRLRKAGHDGQSCIYVVAPVPLSAGSKAVEPLAPLQRVGHDAYTFTGRHKP